MKEPSVLVIFWIMLLENKKIYLDSDVPQLFVPDIEFKKRLISSSLMWIDENIGKVSNVKTLPGSLGKIEDTELLGGLFDEVVKCRDTYSSMHVL